MNKIIFDSIYKRITSSKTKFIASALSYYAIVAIIPTLILSIFILKTFNVNIPIIYQQILEKLSLNVFSNILISTITIYMISKVFFTILKNKKSAIKSLLLSITYSLISIAFISCFLFASVIKNTLIHFFIVNALIFSFLLVIICFSSTSKLRYSIISSLTFSVISYLFIYFFQIATSFFIDYENYYGVLAPIFLFILAIHIFIYISIYAYICAEEFTKISNIKILRCWILI